MDIPRIVASVDHTLLSPTATWAEIQTLCDEAMEYGTASVCIPTCYVRDASTYLDGRIPICTVVGFPGGNCTVGAKLFETKTAIVDGACEVDMVINLGYLKAGRFDKIFSEISGLKAMVGERNILKVIIETCQLTEEEKIRMCVLVSQTGADYIRTSTGFSTGGAGFDDIRLMAKHVDRIKIKASGGIRSLEDAQRFLDLGASRLGASRIIRLLKEQGIPGNNTVN